MPIAVMSRHPAGHRGSRSIDVVTPIRPTQINPSSDRTAHDDASNRRAGHAPGTSAGVGPAEIVSFSRNVTGARERGQRSSHGSAEEAAAAAKALKARLGQHAGLAARAQATSVPERVWNLVND
jgi:hypothetical protein